MQPADESRPVDAHAIAECVRAQLVEAAREAWERAGISGLCAEGRIEVLLDALRRAPVELPPPR